MGRVQSQTGHKDLETHKELVGTELKKNKTDTVNSDENTDS